MNTFPLYLLLIKRKNWNYGYWNSYYLANKSHRNDFWHCISTMSFEIPFNFWSNWHENIGRFVGIFHLRNILQFKLPRKISSYIVRKNEVCPFHESRLLQIPKDESKKISQRDISEENALIWNLDTQNIKADNGTK